MISVIAIWTYAAVTVFLLGYGFTALSRKLLHYQMESILSVLMAGLVLATVYAQVFSLFAGVSLGANILMILLCAAIAVIFRKEIHSYLIHKTRCAERSAVILCGILFLLMAYGTAGGILHYDTALYHAQSIRWIEEYGIVKGLGNLHCRLAYNSASFALSALYSMRFVTGQSFHVMAGFFALILSWECVRIIHVKRDRRLFLSDYARIMAVYYLLMIFDEMVSPASDYFMVTTAFYLVIRYLALLEREEKEPEGYGLLCLLGVFLLTVKLSAALVLLLALRPAALLIKQKKWKETAAFLGMGVGIASPYLIRNVWISGWLVYPFTAIDLFQADWKIPRGLADYDAREIQVWGRGYRDVLRYDIPVRQWIGSWYRQQSYMDRLFIAAAAAAVLVVLVRLALCAAAHCRDRGKKAGAVGAGGDSVRSCRFPDVELTLAACFVFWLFSSPLIRYGCVYVYLTAAVIWGGVLETAAESAAAGKTMLRKAAYLLLILFGCYKFVMFGKELVLSRKDVHWISQKEYDNYPVTQYQLEGLTFYCAETGDQTGYDPFPSAPVKSRMTLRGKDYADGFAAADKSGD